MADQQQEIQAAPSKLQSVIETKVTENKVITQVEVKQKGAELEKSEKESSDIGLQKLAEQHVEPVDEVKHQVSLADKGDEDLIQPLDEDDIDYTADVEQAKGEADAGQKVESKVKTNKKSSAKTQKED